MNSDHLVLSWLNINVAIENICEDMRADNFKPDIIVGLSRGGLVPAVMISHALEVDVFPLKWATRDFPYRDLDSLSTNASHLVNKNVLVVDDIVDSGKTLIDLLSVFHNLHIDSSRTKAACIIVNPEDNEFKPDYYGRINHHNKWVDFPWERLNDATR